MISEWIERQSLPMLLFFIAACLGVIWALGVLDWWIAHQLNWWVYALLVTGSLVCRVIWQGRRRG